MSIHFPMGALNKETKEYEYSKIANKNNEYECPSCSKDVIFRSGKKNKPHFAHCKSDNPCSYYEKPNESQIHKEGKLIMINILHNNYTFTIYRNCVDCKHTYFEKTINNEDYTENTWAKIEYVFYHNDKKCSADVALVENKIIKYIFEICYTHKTDEEKRPEPWFEIDAVALINNINSIENTKYDIRIPCMRDFNCGECKERIEKEIEDKRIEEEERIERKRIEEEENRIELIRIEEERIERNRKEEERRIYYLKKIEEERIERNRKEEADKLRELKKEIERKRIEEEGKYERYIELKQREEERRIAHEITEEERKERQERIKHKKLNLHIFV